MSEKIMFLGREVFEAKEIEKGSCVGCVADKYRCDELANKCFEKNTIYVYAQPPIDVLVATRCNGYVYFFGGVYKVYFHSKRYSTRRAAIRGAKRFCAKIGFMCRIKEEK